MKKHFFLLSFLVLGLGLMAQSPRLSLYEEFTGETCPPCAATNPGLNLLLKPDSNLIVPIKWQVPIPSAPSNTWSLYQTDKTEIDWRWKSTGYGYNPAINSAPSSKIDGQEATVFGANSSHPADLTHTVITTAQSYTSAFSVTMTRAWNKGCTAVTLTVSIIATAPFTSVGSLVFRTVMVEREIHFATQPGTNGEKNFEDPAIKSFPTLQAGTSLPGVWTVGQSKTFTLSCALPSYTRNKDQVAFVGFIQDDGTRKVAQAVRANKVSIPTNAVSALSAKVDLTCNNVITPTVQLKNEGTVNAITALTLTPYIDGNAGSPVQWTGNLAPGAVTTATLGSVASPVVGGSHTFSCDIDMTSPLYNLITNATKINYMVGANYQGTPVVEGFSAALYPPAGFGVINTDNGPGWSRSIFAGGYNKSNESTKYDFFNNTVIGDKDELYLPPMDLSSAPNPHLSFDLSYAQRNVNSDDALEVLVSSNCGNTWTSVYSAQGFALVTSSASPISSSYVPDQSDSTCWRTDGVNLTNYKLPNLLVKFVTTSDNGNNLYLDNINLAVNYSATGLSRNSVSASKISVYPNPTNGTTQIKMDNMKAGEGKVTLTNTLGQVMYQKQVSLNEGSNTVQLDMKDYAVGVYNVTIDSKAGSVVKKLTVAK